MNPRLSATTRDRLERLGELALRYPKQPDAPGGMALADGRSLYLDGCALLNLSPPDGVMAQDHEIPLARRTLAARLLHAAAAQRAADGLLP